MNDPIALVVFDIAGTTVKDSGEISIAFQTALEEFGYHVPVQKINPLMGYKKTEAIKRLLAEYEENGDKITLRHIDKIHKRFLELMIQHYATAKEITPLPYAEEVFTSLKQQGIQVALNTGFSTEITDVIIERLGWVKNSMVDHVICSNQVQEGRPFPFMIEELMKKAGVKNSQSVVKVGDTEVDVHEGKNAHCRFSVGITTGAFTREELEPHYPSFIIDDLRELLPIISHS